MDVDFTEKLIQAIRDRPCIYLLSHPDFKNNMKKLQAWREIQRDLNEDVVTLKAKWKNLKDSYKKYKQSKTCTSGQAAKKLQNWTWADQMSFIDPAVTLNETEGSMASHNVEVTSNETQGTMASHNVEEVNSTNIQASGGEMTQESRPQVTQNGQQIYRRHRGRNSDQDPTDKMIGYLENRKNRNKNECDGVDLLFLGYADSFKKLSKRSQIQTKFDIARILMEAELRDLENSTNDSPAPGSSNYSSLTSDTSVHAPPTPGNYSVISESVDTPANYSVISESVDTPANYFVISRGIATPGNYSVISESVDTPANYSVISRGIATPGNYSVISGGIATPANYSVMISEGMATDNANFLSATDY